MTAPRTVCWNCGAEADAAALDYEAVLMPRSAGKGGPVLVFRCHACGVDNVVEKNEARERLLVPPPVVGLRSPTVRGPAAYAARKWAEERAAERTAFHARSGPSRLEEPAPEGPRRRRERKPKAPDPETPARESAASEDPSDEPEAVEPREIGSVLAAYEVLDLPLTADVGSIRKRYRELSRKCHPDRVADLDDAIRRTAERRFREIRRAYDLLMEGK